MNLSGLSWFLWLILALLASGAEGVLGAALEWRWSHPEPHGNNIADMVFRQGTYVQVTDHGGVYVSTNRLVWERRETGTLVDLRAATFHGGRLVVTGEEGTVVWSDDSQRFEPGTLSPSTTDWLEGVASSGDRLVAVGDNGAVYRSSDATAWERVAAGVFSEWLSGVAYGAGLFVLTGEGGLIASSPDGATWTRRRSGVTVDLSRVVFGEGRFVAVGDLGTVLTSTSGTAWTQDPSTGTTNQLATAVAASGERLVGGTGVLALRRPPFVWQDQTSSSVSPVPAPLWNYAGAVWDGTRYVVGGRTGVVVESFRTNAPPFQDATFWLRQEETPRNWLWDVAWVGGAYLAVGDRGTVLSSPTGLVWELETVPEAVVDGVLFGVGGSEDFALAVGENGWLLRSRARSTNVVVGRTVTVSGTTYEWPMTNQVSLVGLEWELVEPRPTTNTLQGVGWDGQRFVVVGGQGTILSSEDATRWSGLSVPGQEFLSSVACTNGLWVVTGSRGAIYTSPDTRQWTRQNSGTSQWVYRVSPALGGWVAVGERGLILTSPDGSRWTPRVSGTTSWLAGVRPVGEAVYVCGTQGTILRTTNLVDWTAMSSLTGKALYGMADRGGQLVVAGSEGVILRTVAEPAVAGVRVGAYRHFREVPPGVEAMLFQGAPELRIRWEGAESLGRWTPEADLELNARGEAMVGRPLEGAARFHRATVRP